MAEKNVSQAQQAAQKIVEEQIDRLQAMTAEVQRLEAQGVAQARQAIDEAARLMKESLAYGLELAATWRNLTIEASRKSLDLLTVRS